MKRIMWAAGGLLLCSAGPAAAQFDNQWVAFQNQTSTRLSATPDVGASDPEEKDYAVGDFNRDGWTDLVVVRKEPFTTPGKRRGVLFMNENGVLVDRTSQYASASSHAGDQGLLTPANNRDVVVADFNNDGWPDFATAVTISDSDPKYLSHPRIYMNLGAPAGTWLGFRFEENNSPQLYVLNGDGTPNLSNPWPGRFCSIAAGDVDNDGDVDLYLGDYDGGSFGNAEPAGKDINDRLWINNGAGVFQDSYQTRMSATMLLSAFSAAANIADMNGDGVKDVVKSTGLQSPQRVSVSYNRPPDTVPFDLFQTPYSLSPYFVSVGDLNNDNRLDMVVTDDNADRYILNTGNDALGQVIWGAANGFNFLSGGDDGFGSQSLIVDLDADGFKDVLISDVDVDDPTGYSTGTACPGSPATRRLHIYHNLGNVPNVTLREEAQTSGNTGWKGAVGLTIADLRGTHNVAALDIDRDGDKDLVIGRTCSTEVWINTTNPCVPRVYGQVANNSTGQPAHIAFTGVPAASVNNFVLRVTGLPPGASGFFAHSPQWQDPCVAFDDGFRCIGRLADKFRPIGEPFVADNAGVATINVDMNQPPFAGLAQGTHRFVQVRYFDPSGGPAGINYSDALDIRICE